MIFLCIFLILLGVCTVAFVLYQCNIKITEYKRQILTLNNQLSKYKDTTYKKSNNDSKKNLIINFNKPEFRYGITLPYTSIFIAPSEESISISKIKEKSQGKFIFDSVFNNE